MTFIYDLYINLSEELYDFYDWKEEDTFIHIRKTPIFRVSLNMINDIITNKIRISIECINNISNKTYSFDNNSNLKYACVLSSKEKALFLVFNKQGFVIYKSNFLVSEELEILDIVDSLKETKISYNIVGKNKISNMLREEKVIVDLLVDELESIKEDNEKIDYLYYEWFNEESGKDKYNKLIESIKETFTDKHKELLNIVNLCIKNK